MGLPVSSNSHLFLHRAAGQGVAAALRGGGADPGGCTRRPAVGTGVVARGALGGGVGMALYCPYKGFNASHERQAAAQACARARERAVNLGEQIEDSVQIGRADALRGVLEAHRGLLGNFS